MVEISQKVLWIVLELVFVDEMQAMGERLQGGMKKSKLSTIYCRTNGI
jgi:hypothetical protein